MVSGIAGGNGLGEGNWSPAQTLTVAGILIAWLLPSTQEWLGRGTRLLEWVGFGDPARFPGRLYWRPTTLWAWTVVCAFSLSTMLIARQLALDSPFLYFQF